MAMAMAKREQGRQGPREAREKEVAKEWWEEDKRVRGGKDKGQRVPRSREEPCVKCAFPGLVGFLVFLNVGWLAMVSGINLVVE